MKIKFPETNIWMLVMNNIVKFPETNKMRLRKMYLEIEQKQAGIWKKPLSETNKWLRVSKDQLKKDLHQSAASSSAIEKTEEDKDK